MKKRTKASEYWIGGYVLEGIAEVFHKLNVLGKNLQKSLFKEEYQLMTAVRTSEFEEKHKTIAKINRLVDNWRGLLSLFLIFYMLGFLYLILWYADGTIKENQYFHPVVEYCKSNYTDSNFVERTSDFTQTKCYNPYAKNQICPAGQGWCFPEPEYQGGLEVNSSNKIINGS